MLRLHLEVDEIFLRITLLHLTWNIGAYRTWIGGTRFRVSVATRMQSSIVADQIPPTLGISHSSHLDSSALDLSTGLQSRVATCNTRDVRVAAGRPSDGGYRMDHQCSAHAGDLEGPILPRSRPFACLVSSPPYLAERATDSLDRYISETVDVPHTFEQLRTGQGAPLLVPLSDYLTTCHHPNIVAALLY